MVAPAVSSLAYNWSTLSQSIQIATPHPKGLVFSFARLRNRLVRVLQTFALAVETAPHGPTSDMLCSQVTSPPVRRLTSQICPQPATCNLQSFAANWLENHPGDWLCCRALPGRVCWCKITGKPGRARFVSIAMLSIASRTAVSAQEIL